MKNPLDIMTKETFKGTNGLSLPYLLYLPADYAPSKKYAFILYLHGAGERGNDNTAQIKYNGELAERIINDEKLSSECIIAAPQCPEEMQWVNTPWAEGSYSLKDVEASLPMQTADELLDSILNKYSIDKSRIYISGISMGGFGTWNMLMRRPEIFAAAVPVCGGADPSMAAAVKSIPIRTFHSTGDPVVPVSGTREMTAAVKAAGGNIEYKEYPSDSHNCWTDAFHEPDLTDWLFSQKK